MTALARRFCSSIITCFNKMLMVLLAFYVGSVAIAAPNQKPVNIVSTDTKRAYPDKVYTSGSGKAVTLVIKREGGIGSAKVDIAAGWKGDLRILFKDFGNLESFVINDNKQCISGALRQLEYLGKMEDGHCNCTYQTPQDLLMMKSDGKNIRMKVPPYFIKPDGPTTLTLGWIDAYRN